jgi:hypothetical protein
VSLSLEVYDDDSGYRWLPADCLPGVFYEEKQYREDEAAFFRTFARCNRWTKTGTPRVSCYWDDCTKIDTRVWVRSDTTWYDARHEQNATKRKGKCGEGKSSSSSKRHKPE